MKNPCVVGIVVAIWASLIIMWVSQFMNNTYLWGYSFVIWLVSIILLVFVEVMKE